jgi:hypothetical protein
MSATLFVEPNKETLVVMKAFRFGAECCGRELIGIYFISYA